MARPRTSPKARVLARAQWDADHIHLIWKGKMVRGKPRLSPESIHPLRVLLELEPHPRIRVQRQCSNDRCIREEHYRIYLAQDHKYGDLSPPDWRHPTRHLSANDYAEIETIPAGADLTDYPPRIRDEVIRRRNLGPQPPPSDD